MKPLFSTLATIMISSFIYAQNKIDTLVYAQWNGSNWQNNTRTISSYDADCRLSTDLIQSWNTGSQSWINLQLTTYNYLVDDYLSSSLSQNWNNSLNKWDDNYRKTITYDGSFKILSIVDQISYFGQWQNYISTTYKYDSYGFADSVLLQFATSGQFVNTYLQIYTNNSDGTQQEYIAQNWNATTSSWDNSSKYFFTYNSDKTVNTAIIDLWNATLSSWQIDQQQIYTYSGTGKLLNYLTQGWQTSQWVNQSLFTNTYDNNDFLIRDMTQFWNGTGWDNFLETNYTNNNDGSIHQQVMQQWDAGSNAWINNTQRTYSYSSSCLLPLKILQFTANKNGNATVDLKWQTSEEINTSRFSVQRSLDGVNFTSITNIYAKGNSSINYYEYVDNIEKVIGDKIYYKLKVIDKDGSYIYSKIIPISLITYARTLKVYPNPAKDQLFVLFNLENSNKAELRITDISGKTVYNQFLNNNQNNSITNINISPLSKGVYYLVLLTDTSIQRIQFLKQ